MITEPRPTRKGIRRKENITMDSSVCKKYCTIYGFHSILMLAKNVCDRWLEMIN